MPSRSAPKQREGKPEREKRRRERRTASWTAGARLAVAGADPTLVRDLERLVDADSRGDPESLLLWTSRSVRHPADGLREL